MDAFALCRTLIGDYSQYVGGFLNIKDERLRRYVNEFLKGGTLWPDARLQLNPSYEKGATIAELVEEGLLHPDCLKIFRDSSGKPFRLYRHQEEAIRKAVAGKSYVLTTGTGSGKSLCFFIPIVNHVLRNNPKDHSVRAIIVYPMNALINSQLDGFQTLLSNHPSCPVRVARYTGQEDLNTRERLQKDPPHILLTNYVMLELMLARRQEEIFVDKTRAQIKFLVFDELHTYTGRQGADVALLIRRLKERAGSEELILIGTSATLATEGDRKARKEAVAKVASSFFGCEIRAEEIIDETLKRITSGKNPSPVELEEGLKALPPEDVTLEEFLAHPLASWIESTFGIQEKDGFLERQEPITLREGAEKLASLTNISPEEAEKALRYMFNLGSKLKLAEGAPIFPFKLHQFVAQGENILATLEKPSERFFTAEAKNYAPDTLEGGEERPLYPLLFCRECGQEFYRVLYDATEQQFVPYDEYFQEDDFIEGGYLAIEDTENEVWSDERIEDLPDTWKTKRGNIKREYQEFVPRRFWVTPEGKAHIEPNPNASPAWFLKAPFLFCPSCGIVYTKKEREFRKLASFSSEGRSTATTLLSVSTINTLRQQGVPQEAAKLLSFTDNRQDASLQAGHFNDFVQVALIRSGIYKALEGRERLKHENIAASVFEALALPLETFAKHGIDPRSPAVSRIKDTFVKILEYRIIEDLRRGWRVVQPNLEQVGLLKIEYEYLREICEEDHWWQGHALLKKASPERRYFVAKSFLDFMRQALAINASVLTLEEQNNLHRSAENEINDFWKISQDEFRQASWFITDPSRKAGENEWKLSARSALGKFLRSPETWDGLLSQPMSEKEYQDEFLPAFLGVLLNNALLVRRNDGAVQVHIASLIWEKGDGKVPPPDPVRSRWLKNIEEDLERKAHPFFQKLYRELAHKFLNLRAAEHTGQIDKEKREEREKLFREGKLPVLYCSPTMELGIDIADLNVVHMRNVPPSPANYAQRSGRAGRSGQPAVVVTYCAAKSPHDQYFFRRPTRMIAGSVSPPHFDLENEDMLVEHLHAIWLATTGLNLGHSMNEVLDLEIEDYPLLEHVRKEVFNPQYINEAFKRAVQLNQTERIFPNEEWIKKKLERTPEEFDRAFERWRTLYRMARQQLRNASEEFEKLHLATHNRREYQEMVRFLERKQKEARRQIELLLNKTENTESDFYPYRYLACEGFLPGYNFPRLPIRAYLSLGDRSQFITRPRFLAIREFAPFNFIYHEGQIFMVDRIQIPLGEIESRLQSVRLCQVCGHIHSDLHVEHCQNCNTSLDATTSITTDNMLRLPDVIALKRRRITCDEEERVRYGYQIDTYFKFAPGKEGPVKRSYRLVTDDEELFKATYGPAANLWLVNQGWRRADSPKGFVIDLSSGRWLNDKKASEKPEDQIKRVRLFVEETKNILLIQPISPEHREIPLLASFQAALLAALTTYFDLSEGEIAATRVGQDEHLGILLWEASEGSLGVLRKLVDEAHIFKNIALLALDICHFSPDGEDLEDSKDADRCTKACYRCLLSYQNQPDHLILDRFLVRDLLLKLKSATLIPEAFKDRASHYKWLLQFLDPRSDLERRFLDFLFETGRKLPDEAQKLIVNESLGLKARPDFYYRSGNVCIFCDGVVHDIKSIQERDETQRTLLEDAGYMVISIRYDEDLEEQIKRYVSVFG